MKKLKGLNPHKVKGYRLKPTEDMEVYVVPERALEVLDVLIDGEPVMFRNPQGHMPAKMFDSHGLGPLKSIEGFFTAGIENVGPPTEQFPLHGTLSQKKAYKVGNSKKKVEGWINTTEIVVGPDIKIKRKVYVKKGRRAFYIKDTLKANKSSEYMFLYHPCFPVENGTRLVANIAEVVSRDSWADIEIEKFNVFEKVGRGVCRFPPTKPEDNLEKAIEENFERCYAMTLLADRKANVYAALIDRKKESGAYIRFNLFNFNQEQLVFQFWKNPRDSCAGLEIGNSFMGREYAKKNNLMSFLKKEEKHIYSIKIGFLRGKREVREFIRKHIWEIEPKIYSSKEKEISELYMLQ